MMHEKRDSKFHERFFNVLKENVPNLKKTKFPIICKHRATQDDLSVYMRDIRDILDSQSVEIFKDKI